MKKCNVCGNIVSDDAVFCSECGSNLTDSHNDAVVDKDGNELSAEEEKVTVKICRRCGTVDNDGSRFCMECGADLSDPANYITEADEQNLPVLPIEETEPAVSIEEESAPMADVSAKERITKMIQPETPKEITQGGERTSGKKKCRICGAVNAADSLFCGKCGADLRNPENDRVIDEKIQEGGQAKTAVKICRKCGTMNTQKYRFCRECGADLNDPANYTIAPDESEVQPAAPTENSSYRRKCPVCGALIAEGSSYCLSCGAKLNEVPKAPVRKKHKKKHKTGLVIGIVAAACAACGIAVYYFVLPVRIQLEDYTAISVTGYDGIGKASVTIDKTKLVQDLYDAAVRRRVLLNTSHTADTRIDAIASVVRDFDPDSDFAYQLDKDTDLSNGDSVTLSWDVNADEFAALKVNLKTNDIKVNVENLREAEKFDAFENVTVQVSGTAPYGKAEIVNSENNGLTYKLDKNQDLNNGDQIVLTVSYGTDDDFAEYADQYGKIPEKTTQEYTVSGLPSYLSSLDDQDILTGLDQQAQDRIDYDYTRADAYGITVSSKTLLGEYLFSSKAIGNGSEGNCLYMIYEVTLMDAQQASHTFYTYIKFDHVVINEGVVSADDLADGYLPVNTFNFDSASLQDPNTIHTFYVYGYETLGELTNDLIVRNSQQYNYISHMN